MPANRHRHITRRSCLIGATSSLLAQSCYAQGGIRSQVLKGLKSDARVFFNPGNEIVTSGKNHEVTFWKLYLANRVEVEIVTSFRLDPFSCVTFLPDGKLAISANISTGNLDIWRISSGMVVQTLKVPSGFVTTLEISPDRRFLAASGFCPELYVWSLDFPVPSGAPKTYPLPEGRILALSFRDRSRLALVTETGKYGDLDVTGGGVRYAGEGGKRILKAAFARRSGGQVALLSEGRGVLANAYEGRATLDISGDQPLQDIAISGDGKTVSVSSARKVTWASVERKQSASQVLETRGTVNSISLNLNGSFLAACTDAGELAVVDLRSAALV